MSSSDDEQDDNNIFDQLKSIKAFTVEQLYSLHPDVSCPKTLQVTRANYGNSIGEVFQDQNLYQNLVEYEQLKNKLIQLESSVKQLLKKTYDHIDKVWLFNDEAERKIGMCQQGKIAETTVKYKKAFVDAKQLDILHVSFNELSETISRDFTYYSFESQMKRHKIATSLSISYQIENKQERVIKLRSSIATLVDFIKHQNTSKSDFVLLCRRWLRALIKRFLEEESTNNYTFIIAQICRGSAGIADWTADLIECKPFDQVSDFESPPHYITHCSTLLIELFNNLMHKIRRLNPKGESSESNLNTDLSDQNWSLIDPRFSCSEELNLSSNTDCNILTESDILKLCLRIPLTQIFRAYVKKCLETNEFTPETDKNYEYIMLKLLTIGTIIIKTYQLGLESFNTIQYGTLIEYLSSQIRQTVIVLSDKWAEFKGRLKKVDGALLMRLQVEYDNFILRSILIILELRQCGIWRHLARIEQEDISETEIAGSWSTDSIRPAITKLLQATGISSPPTSTSQNIQIETPAQKHKSPQDYPSSSTSLTYEFSIEWFKEVSEPMLWHILWQFHNNAFVSSCDYRGDDYWLDKFKENSVVYLFVNKLKDSPPSECSYLLNSITSILLSRSKSESSLVDFIADEIFNLTFKQDALRDKISKKGLKSLIRSAEKFPHLISLFLRSMNNQEMPEYVVELIRNCSLTGWICSDEEFNMLENWLIENPLKSTHNRCARLIITKLFLNSSMCSEEDSTITKQKQHVKLGKLVKNLDCFVHLKTRRRFALLLHQALVQHLPENNDFGPKSLGAHVEVAFGSLFYERNSVLRDNLIELAVDHNYQQLYVWVWRLLFTLRLHILNQPETDWNEVQSRSGTSRSIKNTVLLEDSFHPVPSIQDLECSILSSEITNKSPVALFVYLLITDITWRPENLESCLSYINIIAKSGHLTPSLLTMEFLTVCHLNDLSDTVAKDQSCLEFFTTILTSNFDSTRVASFIANQLVRLEPARQLQLSEFYITVLFEVSSIILKQQSSSWFSYDEHSLEKIASLLDYIAKFNFTTQRQQIVRKFYNCSYSSSACRSTNSWFGSLFASNSANASSTRREFLTILHILIQKFTKFVWLRFITTECDSIRLERIWEDIVVHLSTNEDANLDSSIKKVCPQLNATILRSTLPIYSWLGQIFDIVESDLSHPLCPLVWYNFFLNYFSNHLNGVSVGSKLISQETLSKLLTRLDSLINYHAYKNKNWASASSKQQRSLAELYRAYKIWLQDRSLLDAYVEFDRKEEMYLVPLLKSVMSSTEGACIGYMDADTVSRQNHDMCQIWSAATKLRGNPQIKHIISMDTVNSDDLTEVLTSVEDEASDAISLVLKSHKICQDIKYLSNGEEELKRPIQVVSDQYMPVEESLELVKMHFNKVFEESSIFTSTIAALDKSKHEIAELIQLLYNNKKREVIRVVPCVEGSECPGPARIKFEIEEATIDDRKSECILDRQCQCKELVAELLTLPSKKVVHSTILIEDYLKQLIKDESRAKIVIETLISWISQPATYNQLNGTYHVTNHILKNTLEILSNTKEVNSFNSTLIDTCFDHPGSVQIFSPHLSPSSCSTECFLELYERISSKQSKLGPTALFVLLSKFDINSWLKDLNDKKLHHKIIETTCLGLSQMGKKAEDSFVLTLDLYRRHIQIELAPPDRRKPEEIALVLKLFLEKMSDQLLYPNLWSDFMSIIGFERQLSNIDLVGKSNKPQDNLNRSLTSTPDKSNSSISGDSSYITSQLILDYGEVSMTKIIDHISRFAEGQTVFDYHAVCNLVQIISEFISSRSENSAVTLLELYQDYVEQFSIVLLTVTFMWTRSISENYPDNHDLIWKQFSDLWYHWIYLKRNCQNVSKTSYSLVSSQYVSCLRYMILKMNDSAQRILQSVLSTLTQYVTTTKEVVYLELTILQRCLKNLPWSSLIATSEDFENLALLSEQQNFNVSDLTSHILQQINVKESLTSISSQGNRESLPHVVERLATTIVLQSAHLKGFRLHGSFFTLIPIEHIKRIASLILPRMEFANLEHSQNNKLLVNLLRFMCLKLDIVEANLTEIHVADGFERSLIYAKFVSDYMVELIKNHPTVLKYHKSYLQAIVDNSLQDLKILLSPDVDMSKKTTIYMNLLECCSCVSIDENSRFLIAKCLVKSNFFKNRPIIMMEIFHALGQIMSDSRVLVYTIDKMIHLYLSMNGHYEKVWKSFHLNAIPSHLYLNACVEENATIALLVYFEALTRSGQDNQQIGDNTSLAEPTLNNNKIWSSFFHWLSQLNATTSGSLSESDLKTNDTKLVVAWVRLLDMLQPNLFAFIHHISANYNDNSTDETLDNLSESAIGNKTNGSITSQDKISHSELGAGHKSLVSFLKHLISIYDTLNSGGLWSYLRSTRNEESVKLGIISLAIACFLSDRTLICINNTNSSPESQNNNRKLGEVENLEYRSVNSKKQPNNNVPPHLITIRDEVSKLRKISLSKLESARKSKYYIHNANYIEALIESVVRNDKVQYSEGLQLITTFVKSIYPSSEHNEYIIIHKVLPSFSEYSH